jgi:hypothetical protein
MNIPSPAIYALCGSAYLIGHVVSSSVNKEEKLLKQNIYTAENINKINTSSPIIISFKNTKVILLRLYRRDAINKTEFQTTTQNNVTTYQPINKISYDNTYMAQILLNSNFNNEKIICGLDQPIVDITGTQREDIMADGNSMTNKIFEKYNYRINFKFNPYKIYRCEIYTFTNIHLLGVKCGDSFIYHAIGNNPLILINNEYGDKKVIGIIMKLFGLTGSICYALRAHL